MAEDLDELLDEVESKFCRNVSVTPPSPSSGKEDGGNFSVSQTPKKSRGKKRDARVLCNSTNQEPCKNREDEDINALLEDIFDDDYDSLNFHTAKATKTDSKNSLPQPAGRRCCPVFIGGSSIPSGVGTSISQRACSQLRCTSCDFRVTSFDDHVWDLSCDYLFFRNNMPDCQKLRAKLRRKRNARAYACQCSWHSTLLLTDLRDQPELKWVCGKHEA